MNRWSAEPKWLQGANAGSTIGTEFIWVAPGQYVSLSKTNFINGRYASNSDDSRLLFFQFGDDGSFRCDAMNPQTGRWYKVEIVKPWTFNLGDSSIRMVARFSDPATQMTVESEFSVLDSQWVQEHWSTMGANGDSFWHKVDQ